MKNAKTLIKILLSLGLGIGLIIWFWNNMSESDKTETISAFKRANYFWISLAPILGLAANFVRTQRWRLMLRPIGYNPEYWNTFFAVMIMYFFNLFVPRLGEVTRCTMLAEYEKVPVEKSLGTMVTERLIDVICLGIVFLSILLFLGKDNFNTIYAEFEKLTAGIQSGTLTILLKFAVPVALIVGLGGFAIYYIRKNGVDKLIDLVFSKIKSLFASIFSVRNVKEKPQFILLTIAMWLMYLAMFYVNYKSLPETSNLPLVSALVCLFFGSLAVVLTPGGIGIYPIVIQTILVGFQIQPSIAIAIGMLSWVVQTLGVLLGGMLSLVLLNLINKKEDASLMHEPS